MPRVPLHSGSRLPVVTLPDDAALLAAPPPLDPIADVSAAVVEALRYPLAGEPLAALAPRGGGRVTVVMQPSEQPLPTVPDDPRFTTFVVERGGEVIGSAIACPIEVSSSHASLALPPGAGFLGFAAVFPEHRGLGAGRLLGEAVFAWARETGREWVVTDWRMTNLLSSRAWPRLGFRPTFYRLFRAIP